MPLRFLDDEPSESTGRLRFLDEPAQLTQEQLERTTPEEFSSLSEPERTKRILNLEALQFPPVRVLSPARGESVEGVRTRKVAESGDAITLNREAAPFNLREHVELARARPSDQGKAAQRNLPFGAAKIVEPLEIKASAENISAGIAEPKDYERVADYLVLNERKKEQGVIGDVGDLLAALPGFMIEFAATGGVYSGAKAGAQRAGLVALEQGVSKSVARSVGSRLGRGALNKAAQAPAAAVGVAAQVAANPQLVAANLANQQLSGLKFSEGDQGQIETILKQDDTGFLTDLRNAFVKSGFELGSERAGALLTPLKGAIARRWLGVPGRTPGKLKTVLDASGWHGVIPEMFEERVNELGAPLYGEEYRPPTWRQLAAEAIAFSVPGAAAKIAGRLTIDPAERKDATTTRKAEEVLDEGATAARVPADGQDRANIAPVVAPRQPDSAGGGAPGASGTATVSPAAGTVAPVVYRGYQEGFGPVPGFHTYNLTADLGPKLVKGSTVTEESLAKAGFTIPPAEKAKAIAPVEAPPAPPAPIVSPQPPPTQPTPQGPPPPKKPTTTSAPPADVAKEPWQMRKADGDRYLDENMVNAVKTDKGKVIAKNMEHGDLLPMLEEGGSTFKNPNARGWAIVGRKPSESYIGIADLEPAKGDFHKAWVMKALREGKTVPPEVLADYPDLKPAETKPVIQPGITPAKPTGAIKRESVESGRTGEDLELKPEFSAKYRSVAMLQGGKVIEAGPGEVNHAAIAERLGFPKGLVPGFIDRNGDFVYQFDEDVPKSATPAKPTLRRGDRRDPNWRYLDPAVVATTTKPAKPPKPPTIKQEFDKLVLDYATIHEIQYDPIVTEDVATVPGGARSTHNAEKQRLRRVVFSALGLKGDTMDNADLSAALPKLKEAIAKREAEISTDETEADRAEFPAGTSTEFVPSETPEPDSYQRELHAKGDKRTRERLERVYPQLKEGPQKPPSSELFPASETPFNITAAPASAEKPPEQTTGYGDDTLAQQEMFAIQKIVESKDPEKSANAAVEMYGSPSAAITKIRQHLTFLDSDPDTKKAFKKDQRTMLKNVIALLEQRTESKPSDVADKIADALENLKSGRKPGDIQAFGIIPAVWDAAVSIAQGIIRAGGKVADAVAAAIAHIKANHKGEWDEAGARSALEIASAEEPASTPQGLSDPKDDEVPLATDEWVETRVKGKAWFVRGRDRLTPESTERSLDVARNAFEEAGFAPEERTMYDDGDRQIKSFLFLPKSGNAEANGQKLVTILARELKDQRAEGKLADHVAALVVSVRENFDMTDSAIGQMTTATRNKLFALAQEEASWRGRALRALANFKADLIRVSRNVDVFLNRIHVTAFDPDGEVARFMRDVGTALSSELSEDDIARLKAKLADPKERPRIIAAIKRALATVKAKGKIGWKVMRDIERLVESGIINDDEAIAALAKKHGWTIPTDAQKAEMRRLADRRDALLKPSAAELEKAGDDPLALQRLHNDIKGAVREEVLKIEKRLATMWSEFTKPVSLRNAWVQRENNAKFLNELITANILSRASFGTKQAIDITTQWFWRMPMRGLAQALELRHDDIAAGRVNVFWKDASKQLTDIYADAIKTLRPAVARAVATWTGRAEVRNVERLMSGINALERIRLRAEQLDANGQHGQAFLLKFVGLLRYSFRLASAFDYIHGTPAEWNERRFRVVQALRAQGLDAATANVQAGWVMDETRAEYPEALAMTRSMHEARGLDSSEAELRESAWNMVERRQFQMMNELGLPADDIEANSVLYRNTLGWNEAEKRGIGSLAGETVSAVGRGFESIGLPLAIGRFGNAIAIGINRTLHRTPLYALANFPFWRGSKRAPSAWHRTKTDQYERRLEAAVGTMFGSAVLGLVIAGLAKVWLKPPPDPEERQLWEKQGHKAGTVEFDLGDGNFSVWSLTTGPMSLFAPYLAAGGALNELAVKREKAQAKLNADAAKRGVTPGVAPGADLGDWFGVAWKAAQGSILGNRTTSGLLYSSTDYGLPNVQKFVASQIGPIVPGLPALQEISRMSGVIIDPNKGSVTDLLFPLPTSKARKLNMLGDPVGTEDDVQRVIQTLTGGNYPVVSGSAVGGAYRALLSTGFRPPSIDPNRGHLIGGEYRPLTGSELERYTEARARNLRTELEAIGATTDPKAAREAFQKANTAALRSVGITVSEPRAGRASGRPASVQAPSRVSEGDVGTAGSRERVSGRSAYRSRGLSRLSRGKRLRAVRLRGRRLGRGRLSRATRLRQPRLGRLRRRRGLSRARLLA